MCSLEGKKKTNCEAKSSNMHDYDREKIYSNFASNMNMADHNIGVH